MRLLPLILTVAVVAGSLSDHSALAQPWLERRPGGIPGKEREPNPELGALSDEELARSLFGVRQELRRRMLQARLRERAQAGELDKPALDRIVRLYRLERAPEYVHYAVPGLIQLMDELESEMRRRLAIYRISDLLPILDPDAEAGYTGTRQFMKEDTVQQASNAVAAIVSDKMLTSSGPGAWTLQTEPLTTVRNGSFTLCDFSDIYGLPSTEVRGTAFLVDSTTVVTAAHVVRQQDFLDDVAFVFGYRMTGDTSARTEYTDDEVYRGEEILLDRYESGQDIAVLRLDRPVTGRAPVTLPDGAKIDSGDLVYMIGHPNGLPQMYSGPTGIEDNSACWFFNCRLDTYNYNSGSPVFNRRDDRVEGVLVSDAASFREYCECYGPKVFSGDDGRAGVTVMRSNVLMDYLERPDGLRLTSLADSITAIVQTDSTYFIAPGESRTVGYASPMILVEAGGIECFVYYYPVEGQEWEISETPGVAGLAMDPAGCTDDVVPDPQ